MALSFLYITGSIVELMGPPRGLTPRDTSQDSWYQCPLPRSLGELPPTRTCTAYPPTLAGRSGSVFNGVTAFFPLGPDAYNTLCVPSKSEVSVSSSPVGEVLQSNPAGHKSCIL